MIEASDDGWHESERTSGRARWGYLLDMPHYVTLPELGRRRIVLENDSTALGGRLAEQLRDGGTEPVELRFWGNDLPRSVSVRPSALAWWAVEYETE